MNAEPLHIQQELLMRGRLFLSEENNAGTYILHWRQILSFKVPCGCQTLYLLPTLDSSGAARPKYPPLCSEFTAFHKDALLNIS